MRLAALRADATGASRARSIAGLAVVGAGTLIGPLDSAVNIAFPDITRSFGLPLQDIQWVVICYVLTYSSLLLAFGKLGDLFGYRIVFIGGLAISALALALCSVAWRFEALLIFRSAQGIGTALVIACGPALATSLFEERLRPRILGLYVTMFAVGQAIGPSLGGLLVDAWGWPAVFWFRCPIALAALLLSLTIPPGRQLPSRGSFDVAGALLIALSLAASLLALNRLQAVADDPLTLVLLCVVAAAAFAALAYRQTRVRDPIFRIGLFRDPDFALLNLANCLVNLVGFSVMLLVPYYLDRIAGYPAWMAGLVLAASPVGMMLTGSAGGWAIGRLPAGLLGVGGCILVGGGTYLIGQWAQGASVWVMLATLLLAGGGLGLFQVFYLDVVAATLPPEERGVAGSLGMLTRTIGVVLGATGLTLLLRMTAVLYAAVNPDELAVFLAAFQATFTIAGGGLLGALALSALRYRMWFPPQEPAR